MDGIEEAVSLFPAGSAKAIQRLLKRAQDCEVAAARRNVAKAPRGAGKSGRLGKGIGSRLAGELAKAVRQRGAPRKEAASIRQKAPNGGGKPFHFAHSVVCKADPAAPAGSRAAKTGVVAAHMRYIERETAVEAPARGGAEVAALAEDLAGALVRDAAAKDGGAGDREPGKGRDGGPTMGSAAAAQGYVENPVKLANGEQSVFSFGNIGDRVEDRVAFWTALEAAEAHPDARVQHRLIVELPHKASPAARHEIVRGLAKRFEDDGVPYWAALHAPGRDNDSRNYHAHIVYSERPARRMVDPADQKEKWDFEVEVVRIKASRNRVTTRPHRQGKLRSYHDRRFIPELRKAYAAIANEILARDGVTDAAGAPVRYDHRSYKDMGLDVVPMASVNRIVADKLKDGTATVLDGDYTRKMVAAEIQRAARDRDRKVLELLALDRALGDVAKDPAKAAKVNPRLPKAMRVSPLARVSRPVVAAASKKMMEARHAALRLDVMERATCASLERIVEATDPKVVAAAARSRDPAVRAQAPDPATAALLHEAAKEELAETRAQAEKSRSALTYKVGWALESWRMAVSPALPEPSPVLKARMRSAARDRREGPTQAPAARPAAETIGADEPERGRQEHDWRTGKSGGPEAARPEAALEGRGARPAAPTAEAVTGAGPVEGASRAGTDPGATGAERMADGARTPASEGPEMTDGMMEAARTMSMRLLERTADGLARGVKPTAASAGPKPAPTVAEALMASQAVGNFLTSVKKLGLTVDQRLDLLQLWSKRPIRKPMSAGPAPETAKDGATPGRGSEPPVDCTGVGAMPDVPEVASKGGIPVTVGPAADASATVSAAGKPEQGGARAVGGEIDGPKAENDRSAPPRTPAMVVGEPEEMGVLGVTAGGGRTGALEPAGTAPTIPGRAEAEAAAAPVESDGSLGTEAGEKRRKRPRTPEDIEEEERRKKKRRAVLAKRNKRGKGL